MKTQTTFQSNLFQSIILATTLMISTSAMATAPECRHISSPYQRDLCSKQVADAAKSGSHGIALGIAVDSRFPMELRKTIEQDSFARMKTVEAKCYEDQDCRLAEFTKLYHYYKDVKAKAFQAAMNKPAAPVAAKPMNMTVSAKAKADFDAIPSKPYDEQGE